MTEALESAIADAAARGDRVSEAAARLDLSFYRLSSLSQGWGEFMDEAHAAVSLVRRRLRA